MSPQQTAPPAAPVFDPSQNYQGSNSGPAAFDPGGSYQPTPSVQKPEDKGTLEKVWDWANKGLISGKTLLNVVGDMIPRSSDMKEGESTVDYLDRVQNHIDPDHPYLNALKVGLAGVDKDVAKTLSSFSSPLSIALMGGGAATKLPGAAGTLAKTAMTASGAGFAGKGVSDIAEAGTENTPEAWQKRLQGGAEVAGGGAMAEPGLSSAADVSPGVIRAAARGANKALAKAPGTVGAAVGAAAGAATHIPYAREIGAGIGAMVGREVLPQIRIPGEGFGLPDRVAGGPPSAPYQDPIPGPGAPNPTATPEQLNPALVSPSRTMPGQIAPEQIVPNGPIPGVDARPSIERIMPPRKGLALPAAPAGAELSDLPATGAKSAAETGESLGNLPPKAVAQAIKELGLNAPLTELTSRASQIAKLSELLGQGLGAKELQPNVPIREQGGIVTPKSEALPASDIPEGHTPVDSSALKSYKYDSEAREFEALTQDGQHYVYGDVPAEAAAKFEAADSKGRAWGELRKTPGVVRVAKVINGKRVATRPVIFDEDQIPSEEWKAGHDLGSEVEGSAKR